MMNTGFHLFSTKDTHRCHTKILLYIYRAKTQPSSFVGKTMYSRSIQHLNMYMNTFSKYLRNGNKQNIQSWTSSLLDCTSSDLVWRWKLCQYWHHTCNAYIFFPALKQSNYQYHIKSPIKNGFKSHSHQRMYGQKAISHLWKPTPLLQV